MNECYRTKWNAALGASVAISELGRRCGRGGAVLRPVAVLMALGGCMTAGAQTTIDYANGGDNTAAVVTTTVTTLNSTDAGAAIQSGVISGAGSISKTGPGTLALTGANTHAGGTVLSAGTLLANNDTAFGTGTLTVQGGAIGSQNNAVLSNNMVVGGDFAVANGGPGVPPAPPALSILGSVSLATDARITLTTESVFALGGPISGNHGLVLDATSPYGNFVFKGTQANTYTGLTRVQGNAILGLERSDGVNAVPGDLVIDGRGMVYMRTSEQIADNATVMVNSSGNLGYEAFGFQVPGQVETIAALYGTGPVALSGSKLVVGAGDFSGTLGDGALGLTGGQLEKTGSGTLTLSGLNTFTGPTTVSQGVLKAGAANTLSSASAHTVAAGATLDLNGHDQTVAALNNSGLVSLLSSAPGATLTVKGPYVGSDGTLRLGTAIGDGSSVSDRLVLDGPSAVAIGKTAVSITNLGGLGAQTIGNGIEVIAARNGGTTTAQSTKDAFSLAGGHVDAGAFEYRLYAADATGAGESWYLRSEAPVVPPVDPGNPGGDGPTLPPTPPVFVSTYRAEVPLFAALPEQLRQGNYAMLGNMHQRIGDGDGSNGAAGVAASGSARRAWGRVLSTDLNMRQGGTVSPTSDGRLTGFQAGTDVWAQGDWRAGLYVGQLEGDMRVNGFARGIRNLAVGRNDLRNQYLGLYGTYANDGGFYADAVLQAGRHRYSVQPAGNPESNGKGSSMLASIEVGQSFKIAEGWRVEPQLQLVHQSLSLDDVALYGAQVRQDTANGWLARAGVRVKGEVATGLGLLQPYGRLNVYRASSGTDTARFVGPAAFTDIQTRTGHTSTELAGGFTLALSPSTSLYGEFGKTFASGGRNKVKTSVQGSLGVQMKW